MRTELKGYDTRVLLSDEPWSRGIQRLIVGEREIPFLLPALSGHHFFTGVWPPPPGAIDYEPHESPGALTRTNTESGLLEAKVDPDFKIPKRGVESVPRVSRAGKTGAAKKQQTFLRTVRTSSRSGALRPLEDLDLQELGMVENKLADKLASQQRAQDRGLSLSYLRWNR